MKEADWELGRKQTARTNTIQQQKTYSFICFLPQLPPLLLYLVLVISIFPLFISPSRSLFSTGTFWVQCPLILFWARCPLFSRFPKSSLLPPALLPLFHNVLMSNSFSPFLPTSLFLSFAWSILLTFVSLPLYFLLYLFSHIIFPLFFPIPPPPVTCVSSPRCWRQVSGSWWRRSDSGRCPAATWARWLQTPRWPVSHEAEGWSRTGLLLPLRERAKQAFMTTL